MRSGSSPQVCIVGAGPYGLSVAAHLRSLGLEFRIFGSPMRRWRLQMPARMLLKSEGCASNLAEPSGQFSLERYCATNKLAFGLRGEPVSRETFLAYAMAFQREFAPDVEDVAVSSVEGSAGGFTLRLDDGETLSTQRVIIATGLDGMAYSPGALDALPTALLSHTADHFDLGALKGKEVAIVGAGQSALETAALLHEEGARPQLIVRRNALEWNPPATNEPRSLLRRLRYPRSGLGEGLQLWLYANAPDFFRALPRPMRLARAKSALGPSGAWWLKDRVLGQVPIHLGHSILKAEARRDKAVMTIADKGHRSREIVADHVIAATGYRFDLRFLPFLSGGLKRQLRHEDYMPVLTRHFESAVPGLYFAGLASVASHGPAMRFLVGANFAARRIAQSLTAIAADAKHTVPRFAPSVVSCSDF
jgi:thioredoxin reductase